MYPNEIILAARCDLPPACWLAFFADKPLILLSPTLIRV